LKSDILPIFHLAFPVKNIEQTRLFYRDVLGCAEGRCTESLVDFNFHGHHLVAHLHDDASSSNQSPSVASTEELRRRHFGIITTMERWNAIAARLRSLGVPFVLEPEVTRQGHEDEEGLLFLTDPSGNGVEVKGFRNPGVLTKALAGPAS
jgi:extradiol dioxygenase family protein